MTKEPRKGRKMSRAIQETTQEKTQEKAQERQVNLLELLSEREMEIYLLVCQGWKNQEIAEYKGITVNTVKFHVTHIMDKLGVSNRSSAVAYGQRHPASPAATAAVGQAVVWNEQEIKDAAGRLIMLKVCERKEVNEVVGALLAVLAGKL